MENKKDFNKVELDEVLTCNKPDALIESLLLASNKMDIERNLIFNLVSAVQYKHVVNISEKALDSLHSAIDTIKNILEQDVLKALDLKFGETDDTKQKKTC